MQDRKLSYKARKNLPKSQFVFPKQRRYPIHDLPHARNALARVAQHGTPAEKKAVRRAVCKKYPQISSCKKKNTKKK